MEHTILANGYNCTVIDRGGTIVKWGKRVKESESNTMKMIKEKTTIPVPEIISSYSCDGKWCIIMEKIEGTTLDKAMKNMSEEDILRIETQLDEYIDQLKLIRPTSDEVSLANYIYTHFVRNIHETVTNTKKFISRWIERSFVSSKDVANKFKDLPPVFCHGDLSPSNIIIRGTKIVGIIDWEYSGWYPYFWDYYIICRNPEEWGKRGFARYKGLEDEIKAFGNLDMNSDIYGHSEF